MPKAHNENCCEWTLWVAIARTGIVCYGIRAADRRGRDAGRDGKEHAEAAAARREADRRHAESMAALKALIEGQAQTNATLAEATAALRVVVERAAPTAGGRSGAAPRQRPTPCRTPNSTSGATRSGVCSAGSMA